jgi:omega-6 fatty acid desaturase (delta-12 desaturase)
MQTATPQQKTPPAWVETIKPYTVPNHWKSTWQMINSLLPFFAIWALMIYSLQISYWLTLALAFLNALFLMRIFIIQHDCGHNSFFKSTKLNNFVGSLLGVITLTPYYHWRKMHAKHHAGSGDLEFRGFGDIDTVTVEEYKKMTLKEKFYYRFYRHPFVMFIIGPTLVFAVMHRFPLKLEKGEYRERESVYATNLALLFIFLVLSKFLGFRDTLMLWAPITIFSSVIGVYLFYVQHQFEDTYWRWHDEWEYADAALRGSSFFKLPRILQWFSGNIGFHHVHHLSPKVPNYNLEKAHYENPVFQSVKTITIGNSFQSMFLHLWDEQTHRLISWGEYYKRFRQQPNAS